MNPDKHAIETKIQGDVFFVKKICHSFYKDC